MGGNEGVLVLGQNFFQGGGDPPLHFPAGLPARGCGVEPAVEEAVQQLRMEPLHLRPGETLHVPHVLLPQGREEGDGHIPALEGQGGGVPGPLEVTGVAVGERDVPELLPAEQGFLAALGRQGIVKLAVEDLQAVALRLAVADEVEFHRAPFRRRGRQEGGGQSSRGSISPGRGHPPQ